MNSIADLLDRPLSERLREYKYRFAQSTVFGLPVLALYWAGPSLGGPEAGRWTGLLQLLLAGWVMYVGAMGMLVEGMIRKKITADAAVATIALGTYAVSAGGVIYLFVTARPAPIPGGFHWAVIIVAGWAGMQWLRGSRNATC